jgi:hypothetical protein
MPMGFRSETSKSQGGSKVFCLDNKVTFKLGLYGQERLWVEWNMDISWQHVSLLTVDGPKVLGE